MASTSGAPFCAGVVLERHRDVGRVGDDDVRLGHVAQHPLPAGGALQRADPALHQWIAFGLLVLPDHLLLGHPEALLVAVDLERVVGEGEQQERDPDRHRELEREVPEDHGHLVHAGVGQRDRLRGQACFRASQVTTPSTANLAIDFTRLNARLHAQQPADAAQRAQVRELGLDRLEGDDAAALHRAHQHAEAGHHQRERPERQQQVLGGLPQQRGRAAGRERARRRATRGRP